MPIITYMVGEESLNPHIYVISMRMIALPHQAMSFVTKFRFHNQGTCNRNNFHAKRNWNVQSLELIFNAKLTCPINSPIIPFECWLRIRNDPPNTSKLWFRWLAILVCNWFFLDIISITRTILSVKLTSENFFFFFIFSSIIHSFFRWLVLSSTNITPPGEN